MQTTDEVDTAAYKPVRCYCCGGQLALFTLKDTWKMRVAGVLHDVPVAAIPCSKCLTCGTVLLDGEADQQIMWCLDRYLTQKGLNTWRHKLYRRLRLKILKIVDRWNYWVYRTAASA
ncbi:hypothetical protein EBZ39_06220 [bacterium]|nr:hypothetical protein [bacterium]